MFRLVLEKAEEPDTKLQTSAGSSKKQASSRKKVYFCFIDYAKAIDCVDHNKLWKILKEMGILDHLTCLLKNLYAGQEATVRTGHGTTDWFQIGKGVCQGCILSPRLFNLYVEYIMRNAGLEEAQARIKIAGRNINNPRDEETVETVADFIFWGSKITADGDCSHEIKRCLFIGRKVITNLDSILKSRDITLSTKVHLVKAMVYF